MENKTELNWERAEKHLKAVEQAYADLIGQPGVNPWFGIGIVASVRIRFDEGVRTPELYKEIMELG